MNYYLGLDVGGTNIKSGIIGEDGKLLSDEIFTYDARACENKEVILENFITILNNLVEVIDDSDKRIKAIGLAFPGPFDYQQGISLIKGIRKYESIYNVNLREELLFNIRKNKYLSQKTDKDLKIVFLHDVAAFALGEIFNSMEKDHKRVIHLCIGTGAGSAFSAGDELITSGEGVPENGWIYNTLFKDSIVDDYISARGLASIAKEYYDEDIDGAKLYVKAVNREEKALLAFERFGKNLHQAVTPFIKSFKADGIILGGEITKSFEFFGGTLENFCRKENVDIRITQNTPKSTLLGLYKILKQGK